MPGVLQLAAPVYPETKLAAAQSPDGADGESLPGEVAETDFDRLGYICNPDSGRRRTVWALMVVLTYSRHCFVWPTHSQKLEEVIAGLESTWEFFGGIPKYLVVDNFPAAVAGTDALHPGLTRGILEYSQHRGFITDRELSQTSFYWLFLIPHVSHFR